MLNGDRYGLDPNKGEVVGVEDPKRDVVVVEDIVVKRGEVVVVAIEEVSGGVVNKDEVVTEDEAELKRKEKEWVEEEVEDPNMREAGKGQRR